MNVLFDGAVVGVVSVRMLRSGAVLCVIVIVIAVVGVTVHFNGAVVGVVSVRMLRMVVASFCMDMSRRHVC